MRFRNIYNAFSWSVDALS